jgi:hypothetical protein
VIGSVTVVGASLAGVSTVRRCGRRGSTVDHRGRSRGARAVRPTTAVEGLPDRTGRARRRSAAAGRRGPRRRVAPGRPGRRARPEHPRREPRRRDPPRLRHGRAGHRRPRPPAARHGRARGVHTLRTLDDARALRAQLGAGGSLSSSAVASSAPRSPRAPARSASTSPSSRRCPRRSPARSGRRWVPWSPDCTPTTDVHLRTGRRRRPPARARPGRGRSSSPTAPAWPRTRSWSASAPSPTSPGWPTAGSTSTAACGPTPRARPGHPGVVAVGDCGLAYDVHAGRHLRAEHWTHALQPAGDRRCDAARQPGAVRRVPVRLVRAVPPARAAGRVDRRC